MWDNVTQKERQDSLMQATPVSVQHCGKVCSNTRYDGLVQSCCGVHGQCRSNYIYVDPD